MLGSPASEACRVLAADGPLEGGQGGLGLLAVDGGPGQLAAAVKGSLVELAAQPIPVGPQLGRGRSLEVWAVRGVNGQGLAPSPRQRLGQLQVTVRLLPIRRGPTRSRIGLVSCDNALPTRDGGQLGRERIGAPTAAPALALIGTRHRMPTTANCGGATTAGLSHHRLWDRLKCVAGRRRLR
jgi:hypothetical protein